MSESIKDTVSRLTAEKDRLRAELAAANEKAARDVAGWKALYEREKECSNALDEDNISLRAAHDAKREIVGRIWKQLGSPTYEELKGRSIYDLIDEIKDERDAAIKERDEARAERDAAIQRAEHAEASARSWEQQARLKY